MNIPCKAPAEMETDGNSRSEDRLLAVLQDDLRHVHIRTTAAIAIAAVFVTQIPLRELRGQPEWARGLTIAGVIVLALAAASYFQYSQELNKLRLRIVAESLRAPMGSAAESWRKQFIPERRNQESGQNQESGWHARNLLWFHIGQTLLLVGSMCVGAVLVRLILFQ